MKKALLTLAECLALPWGLVPFALRRRVAVALLFAKSRMSGPASALARLFALEDDLALLINERATALGRGEHVKHRLTSYHRFFSSHIPEGGRVLDIGCGIGALARSIVRDVSGASVLGIDINPGRIEQARTASQGEARLRFEQADILEQAPPGPFDALVLSNVLEHIEDRTGLLAYLKERYPESRLLVRVPLFERHWSLALRRELGVNYRSDPTHCIEHRLDEFHAEITGSGWRIGELTLLWGEIWAECRP